MASVDVEANAWTAITLPAPDIRVGTLIGSMGSVWSFLKGITRYAKSISSRRPDQPL